MRSSASTSSPTYQCSAARDTLRGPHHRPRDVRLRARPPRRGGRDRSSCSTSPSRIMEDTTREGSARSWPSSVPLADGSESTDLDEYASCIRQADQDLAYLTERLDGLDRPVVLCFFGDHQPGFQRLAIRGPPMDGSTADEIGLEAVQERYTVPYLIWANEKALENGAAPLAAEPMDANDNPAPDDKGDACTALAPCGQRTSLNYLGARLAGVAGLPLTSYQSFLLTTSERIPAINLNGFLTADGSWHWFGEQDRRRRCPERLRHRAIRQPVREIFRTLPPMAGRRRTFVKILRQKPKAERTFYRFLLHPGYVILDRRDKLVKVVELAHGAQTSAQTPPSRACHRDRRRKSIRCTSQVAVARSANVAATPTFTAALNRAPSTSAQAA